MEYVVAFIVAAISAALAYCVSNKTLVDKIKVFNFFSRNVSKNDSECTMKQWQMIVITATVMLLSFAAMIRLQQRVHDIINVCKMTIALVCMVGAGCFDLREKRIPNLFPAVMALGGCVMLALGVVFRQAGAIDYISSSALAAVISFVLLTLTAVLTKQGIGAGDIKLIAALGLVTGVNVIVGTLFFGTVACAVASIGILLLKKQKMSGSVPFGPFLLLGYVFTILFFNY